MPRICLFILSCLFSLVLQGRAFTHPMPAPDALLVLAFYEEGETEPSLMLQAAKNELELFSDKHLEAWMKYDMNRNEKLNLMRLFKLTN